MIEPDELPADSPALLDDLLAGNLAELTGRPDVMLTGFYAIAEVVDGDGKQWLVRLHSPDAAVWHKIGWLDYCLTAERHDDEDDEDD